MRSPPADPFRVEPVHGLVEYKSSWVTKQCAGQVEALAHPQRQAPYLPARRFRQADEAEDVFDPAFIYVGRPTTEP